MGLTGGMHWIIILIIILVLFGAGRVSNLMGELGKGMKSFKQGLNDDDDKTRQQPPVAPQQLPPQSAAPQAPIDITPRPADPVAPPPPASSTDQPL